jgi:iron complex transport system permease protein
LSLALPQSVRARDRRPVILLALGVMFVAITMAGLCTGAVPIAPSRVVASLLSPFTGIATSPAESLVILQVRMPRVLMGLVIGAALAVAGALMQGLFRNPLADPGLIGVSGGAALGAAVMIVMGHGFLPASVQLLGVPVGAFIGGLATTLALYRIASSRGATSTPLLLLAGVAFGALSGALIGLLAYVSDDRQLRDLSFWSLGSLSGSSWSKVIVVASFVTPSLLLARRLAAGLNALSLGEAEAFHSGFPVQRLKGLLVLLVALSVGASVAGAGMIGFVGIVTPHLVRLAGGADHRYVLAGSALLGGGLLTAADAVARVVVAPAELPLGILTAAVGAPFFFWLLMRNRAMLT